ncbi:LAME_0H20010g1_1 [Lachancea meyersii CBS 8951]|uniref:LAME_0H20010g1_1 n=1 Tax=Lachancea meyersii CBS 8951 TaxID=1266667 RepID=A0A1G4KJT4_9SACH|nr:LAME_0H20010g1_1 [Lachancea meyersii CBS 8951]
MATSADTLFQQRSVLDVRDFNLHLSHEIAKARVNFDNELGKRYTDVLDVTEEVEKLLRQSRQADASLMELCFNDAICKLESIPEPVHESQESIRPIGHNSALVLDPTLANDAHSTLAVSEWTLAVLAFAEEPASPKLLDVLVSKFHVLKQINVPDRFATVICGKCELLESAILQHKLSLTAVHWVKLHELFHAFQNSPPFQFKQTSKYDDLAFDFLLTNEEHLQQNRTDVDVQKFLKTPVYKSKSVERVQRSIEDQFQEYHSGGSTDHQHGLTLYGNEFEHSSQLFVHEIDLYCNGIILGNDQKLNSLVESIIQLIAKLKSCGVDPTVITGIKTRLVNCLQERIQQLEDERCEPEAVILENVLLDKTTEKSSEDQGSTKDVDGVVGSTKSDTRLIQSDEDATGAVNATDITSTETNARDQTSNETENAGKMHAGANSSTDAPETSSAGSSNPQLASEQVLDVTETPSKPTEDSETRDAYFNANVKVPGEENKLSDKSEPSLETKLTPGDEETTIARNSDKKEELAPNVAEPSLKINDITLNLSTNTEESVLDSQEASRASSKSLKPDKTTEDSRAISTTDKNSILITDSDALVDMAMKIMNIKNLRRYLECHIHQIQAL